MGWERGLQERLDDNLVGKLGPSSRLCNIHHTKVRKWKPVPSAKGYLLLALEESPLREPMPLSRQIYGEKILTFNLSLGTGNETEALFRAV